jgi:CheY-like chemotaxis protein
MNRTWAGKTVLVVDDSDMVRGCLKHLFQEVGLVVVGEAADGSEAVSMAEELSPDLISLDIHMPVMNGIECHKYLKSSGSESKIIVVSCVGAVEIQEIGMSASFNSEVFVSKLPTISALENALTKVFSSSISSPDQGNQNTEFENVS